MTCKCGAEAKSTEIRLVQRCGRGHIVSNSPVMTTTAAQIEMMTPGQQRAFYAKTNLLDKLLGQPAGSAKRRFLETAGKASTKDLTSTQASGLLNLIEAELEEAR